MLYNWRDRAKILDTVICIHCDDKDKLIAQLKRESELKDVRIYDLQNEVHYLVTGVYLKD